jgi:hypothetical protein
MALNGKGLNPGKRGVLYRVFQKDNLDYPTFLRVRKQQAE